MLILDTQYYRAEYSAHIGWGHGCVEDSVALALRAGMERLILFHHDPNHDDAQIGSMLAEGTAAGGGAREREAIFPALRPKALAA